MFYNNHGENINSSGNEVWWNTNTFDGCAVVNKKMKVGDEIEIFIDGGASGGHVLLGITTMKDDQIKESNRRGTKLNTVVVSHVKVLKNQVRFRLDMASDTEIVQEYNGNLTKIPIIPGYSYRLCATLLFGFMNVTIVDGKSNKFQWCQDLCGVNINLSKDKKNASLKNGNPYAVCAWTDPLIQDKKIGFEVSAVNAHWYYLKVFTSSKSPCEAAGQSWESSMNSELQTVVKIKNPKEQLIISLKESTLTFYVGINSAHCYSVDVISEKPIYLYFELFRLKLRVKDIEDIDEYEEEFYATVSDSIYEIPMENVESVLKVKKRGEVKKSERASVNLDRLKDVLSKKDTASSKLSNIYDFIKKFDKDLSNVECEYKGSECDRAPMDIPNVRPKPTYSDSGIGTGSSAYSTKTTNTTNGTEKISNGATNYTYNSLSDRASRIPSIYVSGGNEDMKSMIKNLQKRVMVLEQKKNIDIASTSVDIICKINQGQ